MLTVDLRTEVTEADNLASYGKILSFVENQEIYKEGDKSNGVYYLLSGSIKFEKVSGSKKCIMGIANKGCIFGWEDFNDHEKHMTSAEAVEFSEVLFLPKSNLNDLMRYAPEFFIRNHKV